MEVSIFPLQSVRAEKSKFIEARLHADTTDPELHARIAGLIETVAKTSAQPTYVAMKPSTEIELGRYNGAALSDAGPFIEFLQVMAAEL